MKIAVIGGGAIGSVLAARLSQCAGVDDVLLVARKSHVDAVNQNGLLIKSAEGEENIALRAAERLDRRYDLNIFAVKIPDLEQAYQENCDFLEEEAALMTQNGVQGANILSTHFERNQMITSIVMFGATFVRPGEVTFHFPGNWILGKPYAPNDVELREMVEVFNEKLPVVISDKIMGMKWLKVFVNFNNCLPALTGKSMQETFADLDLCRLSVMLLKEGVDAVNQAGIELVSLPNFPADRILGLAQMPIDQAAGIMQKTLTNLSKEPVYGSILQSIMRKKVSEIDFINGEIVQVAHGLRVEAPLNKKIVQMVHAVENSGQFFETDKIKQFLEFN